LHILCCAIFWISRFFWKNCQKVNKNKKFVKLSTTTFEHLITLGCGKGASDTNKIYKTGYFVKFEDFVVDNVATVGGVGIGVIILLFMGICVSCYVARGLASKRYHGRLPY